MLGDPNQTFLENRDSVPFGLLATLAGVAVFPGLGRRDAQVAHLAAVLKSADFGVAPKVADENDFVN